MITYKLYKPEYYEEIEKLFDDVYLFEEDLDEWLDVYNFKKDKLYCMFKDGEIIALGAYQPFNDGAWISFITTKLSEQGKGYGKKITKYVMNKAIKHGAKSLLLETDKKEFYEKLGFELYKDWGEDSQTTRYAMDYYVK